jgi:glutaredoxin
MTTKNMNPDSEAITNAFQKLINDNRAILFCKSGCPYSIKAKMCFAKIVGLSNFNNLTDDLFDKDITVYDLDVEYKSQDEIDYAMNVLASLSDGQRTVPRIFIRGKFIGGGDKIVELYENNLLKPMLSPSAQKKY